MTKPSLSLPGAVDRGTDSAAGSVAMNSVALSNNAANPRRVQASLALKQVESRLGIDVSARWKTALHSRNMPSRNFSAAMSYPVPGALQSLFPAGGIPAGSTWQILGATTIMLSLVAAAMGSQAWGIFLGGKHWGWRAATNLGLDLDRVIYVPEGQVSVKTLGLICEYFPVTVMGEPLRLKPSDLAVVQAKLRAQNHIMLTTSPWAKAQQIQADLLANTWSMPQNTAGYLAKQRWQLQSMYGQATVEIAPGSITELNATARRVVCVG